jgi:hypothetical protein
MREIHPNCDESIKGLNKKCRLSYHNLKKFIRERKKTGSIGNIVIPVSSVNANQTTSNLHKGRMLFNQSEIHPNYHQIIFPLKKKHRLSYHNFKKVICEKKIHCYASF